MTLVAPFPAKYQADNFGERPQWRIDMGLGAHRGKDFNGLPAGTPIPASGTGVAIMEGWSSVLGWWVVIRYAVPGGEIYLGYCHLQSRSHLRYGVWVKRGDTVGYLGSTGSATTGVHLHLTASWYAGNPGTVQVVDPMQFFTDAAPAAVDTQPVTNNKFKEDDMRLSWDTGGTGWLNTGDGFHGLGSMQIYILFKRLINSNQSSDRPETFLRAEIDIMNSQLALLRIGNGAQITIDPRKLASAIYDELVKRGIPVTVENLEEIDLPDIDPEELAAAMEAVVPRVSAAILKQAGQLLSAS